MDELILGLNLSHDRAAVVSLDGRIVGGIAEERLDRQKHSVAVSADGSYLATVPVRAMQYALELAGARPEDCREIVAVGSVVYHPERPLRNLTAAEVAAQLPGVDPARVQVINHHFAHALGAYAASPFDEAAVMVADGAGNVVGDRLGWRVIPLVEHATYYHAQGSRLRELKKTCSDRRAMNSLGAMYQLVTMFAGFGMFQEGKTMGLAPYGTPALLPAWDDAASLDGPLSYRIHPTFQTFDIRGRLIPADFVKRFGPPRHHSEPLRAVDKDLAYAVQHTLERLLIGLARDLRHVTKSRNLVLAGGVALNSVANKKIADEAGFENVFIVPCAADDGTALGGALWPWLRDGHAKTWSMSNAALGRTYNDDECLAALRSHAAALAWSKPPDLVEQVAAALADGQIIGWFQGGAEIGPRALGQRSILCDPRHAADKDRLNERVKYREAFRPFAPVVLAERAGEFFDLAGESPFMLLVAKVKQPAALGAVTHVDGTARVQTVRRQDHERFYRLIGAFGRRTGVPVLLNTSFNLAGDPIVETPADAIDCFLKSEIDQLVIGEILIEKRHPELSRDLARKHRELMEARKKIAAQENELEAIRRSRGWRLLNRLNQWRR